MQLTHMPKRKAKQLLDHDIKVVEKDYQRFRERADEALTEFVNAVRAEVEARLRLEYFREIHKK